MNLEPKHRDEEGEDLSEPPRSIFSHTSFRALVAVLVIVVVAVVALPYVLERWSPTPPAPVPQVKAPIPPPPPPLETPSALKAEAPKPAPGPPPTKPEGTSPKSPPRPAQVEAKAPARPPGKGPEASREAPSKAATGGDYWVQVGAFKDRTNAARLAAQLTSVKYPVQRLSLDRPVSGVHEVFVVGASAREVNGKLPGKDLRAEEAGAEVVIRPALPLKEAVSLSKELSRHGLTVKIRRSGSTATFHVVRVGSYPDRQHAQTVQKDLASKGVSGFIVRGEPR